ncbi:MAG: DNA-directed RNA polymerase subunit alpha [Longimicrobiales bacterium]|nr:DNA-directed RNA polymerase subunit alpha [Longimicrobiales bacterium]
MDIDLEGLVLPQRVEAVDITEDGTSARFVVEPLERGFGHTLGNSVRRVLLSQLRGSAVWAFRIDGALHEHQTVPGVVEDVHQIIQNLKSLVVVLDDDVDEATIEFTATGPGVVTAGLASPPSGVAVLDPEHPILTLEEERDLHVELRVNKGRGFVLADAHALPEKAPVDLVRIDSIYNPVRRANFTVEETRVGQRTDFDRLTLQVETDGSVDPESAVRYASALVRRHLEYLLHFGEEALPEDAPEGAIAYTQRLQDLFERDIDHVAELSVRARNSLQKENILTVGDLVSRTRAEMLAIDNFGKKSLQEIQEFLDNQSLVFGLLVEEADDGRSYLVRKDESEETADAQ